jgi:hypothetical protein
MSAASIPQASERMEHRPRMRRTDEGPLSAQNEFRAQHKLSDNYPKKRRMPLMQRLAARLRSATPVPSTRRSWPRVGLGARPD